VIVRPEQERDQSTVHSVTSSAFGTEAEADLVDVLRVEAQGVVSLVAELAGVVVGHIMFSPVSLSGCPALAVMGLGPMSVAPAHRRIGIGTALVREGLVRCRQEGAVAVVVLGHPGYYPRFGFSPASRFGIDSEYDVPDNVFMAIELAPGALDGTTGRIRYHLAFAKL
jgi:putative acetyltransferase